MVTVASASPADVLEATQRMADAFYAPGKFNSLYAYEREQRHPWGNRNVVFAEAMGDMEMASGKPYRNMYVFRFDLEGNKIKKLIEYRNPVTAAIAFDRPLPWLDKAR